MELKTDTGQLFELADRDKAKHVERRLLDVVDAENKAVEAAQKRLDALVARRDAAQATLREFMLLVTPAIPSPPVEVVAEVEVAEPDSIFYYDTHVRVSDLDNQHGIPLIPAMCSTRELLSLTDAMRNETVPAITKAYADKAGFRLKGTLLAAGSTNGGVQDSAHHVQCVSDVHCPSRLTGYCMAEYTCGDHVSAVQKAADEANAPKEEVTDADIEAVLIRGPHVVDANQRILAAYGDPSKKFADVLKHEYGEGGGSAQLADGFWGSTWHNAKGLRVSRGDAERLLKWGEVATWTARLIGEGRIGAHAEGAIAPEDFNADEPTEHRKCDDCAGDECEPCTPAEPRDADSDECEHGDDLTPIEELTAECNPFADPRISKEFAAIDCDRLIDTISDDHDARPQVHWNGEVCYELAVVDQDGPVLALTAHANRPIGAALKDATTLAEWYAAQNGLVSPDITVEGSIITMTFEGAE